MERVRYDPFHPLQFNFNALQFVRAVTDAHDLIEVGRTLQTQTKTVQAIRCEPTAEARKALGAGERENIVFVDTPSFLTEPDATKKAVSEMTTWLEESKYDFLHLLDVTMTKVVCSDPSVLVSGRFTCTELKMTPTRIRPIIFRSNWIRFPVLSRRISFARLPSGDCVASSASWIILIKRKGKTTRRSFRGKSNT